MPLGEEAKGTEKHHNFRWSIHRGEEGGGCGKRMLPIVDFRARSSSTPEQSAREHRQKGRVVIRLFLEKMGDEPKKEGLQSSAAQKVENCAALTERG